ncbi:sarcosine oxidase subunit gamma [Xinfangfangia sp. CPCC 101601]|uniref:Sarcosine oxidase subunit gamma n=1 Tax=Pseudogemmobacter lacusdianii TaxID=3069608 RepID=A0ABU0VZ02_9RHOB|nr:sarcosine oxidase subunit gamma [Xinfangfangia sp. CPCC 101601]MDQ2066947.1 sarcosine oxidase subunit gamma [Xinfangfangia sp. CPCC 101601]
MADTLHALTALGQAAPQTRVIGPYRIEERFDVALASVASRRGREAEVASAAAAAGIPLPGPARFTAGPLYAGFWVAPEMWFVEAPFASHEDIVAVVKPIFGEAASITEQTDAWVRFDVLGTNLAALVEKLCNVDFARAADGYATRTVIEHMGCYLIRHTSGALTIYGGRSSAQSLLHALEVTAASLL